MPALVNTKHEQFARNLARGMSKAEAHELAGFAYSTSNASVLARNPKIVERVKELQAERAQLKQSPGDWGKIEGAVKLEDLNLDQVWILKQLMVNVKLAQESGNIAGANKTLEMLGAVLGMSFTDPKARGSEAPAKADNPVNVNVLLDFANSLNTLGDEGTPAALPKPGDSAIDVTPPRNKGGRPTRAESRAPIVRHADA